MSIIAVYGPVASFKSTFAFSMPGKKFIFDLERGTSRASWRFPDKSQYSIWTAKPLGSDALLKMLTLNKTNKIQPIIGGQREAYEEFLTQYDKTCRDDTITTIVIDTAKVLWDMVCNSYLQELQEAIESNNQQIIENNKILSKDKQIALKEQKQSLGIMEYRTPGDHLRMIMLTPKSFNKHLVVINHERPVRDYEGKIIPNLFEIDGFNQTERLADWVLETRFEDNLHKARYAIIKKSPIGQELVGLKLRQVYGENNEEVIGFDYSILNRMVEKLNRVTLS